MRPPPAAPHSVRMDVGGIRRCPECGTASAGTGCPRCGLPLSAAETAEVWRIDAELGAMAQHRAALLGRRAALMAALRAQRTPPQWGAAPVAPPRARPDASPPSVQTVLLVLGTLLLTVAVTAFTLLSWGHLTIGGRATVLVGLTALAFAAHAALRRRLPATAETAAAVGLVLVLLDCYAARAAGLGGLDGTGAVAYAAWVTAGVGLGIAVYGSWAGSLLLPSAGLVLLQAAAPLIAVATGSGAVRIAVAFALAAAFDLGAAEVLPRIVRADAPRAAKAAAAAARIAAAGTAVAAGWAAAAVAVGAASYGPALRACGPLLLVAVIGAVAARRGDVPYAARVFAGVVTGASGVVAVAALPHAVASAQWRPAVLAVPAAALAVAATWQAMRRAAADRPLWYGFHIAGGGILAVTVLRVLPQVTQALAEPLRRVGRHAGPGRLALGDGWAAGASGPVVVALLAGMLGAGAVLLGRRATAGGQPLAAERQLLVCGAAVAGVVAVATAAPAAGLPYGAALAVAWAPALTAALWIVRRPQDRPAGALCVLLAAAALALVWSLPNDAAALTVWSATALLAAGLGTALREDALRWLREGAAAFAVLALGVVAARAGMTAELPVQRAAFAVLAVAALSIPAAAALRSVAVETAGYGVAAAALLMTVAHPTELSVALALAGCAALGVALRPDRRQGAALAGTVLLTAASWVRLVLAGVTAPEPYALPVAAIALVLGHVRRRRPPGRVGSWAAYGTGLTAGLVPSLGAALADAGWVRPLLLGLAALGVTLCGAKGRLAAPLLVGGGVLAIDALHELAPAIVQTLGLLPRWAAPALGGFLLIYLGATYERRLSAARRLTATLRRLS